MIIYPAIDLMGGRCVRLAQGRFEEATVYSNDPADALRRFAASGATDAHIVDLDGARGGAGAQHALLSSLARSSCLRLQVAGGFRTREQVEAMLKSGAHRVVIGSLAIERPEIARALIEEFGAERIGLALDVQLVEGVPMVAYRGWTEVSGRSLEEVAADYPRARHILVTDISRDGMQGGANAGLVRTLASQFPALAIQASGGFASLDEIQPLRDAGAAGVIVGKALWEGRIDLGEAVNLARG